MIVPNLEAQQEGQGLQAKITAINKVSEEDVVLIARDASVAFFKRSQAGSVDRSTATTALLLLRISRISLITHSAPTACCTIGTVFNREVFHLLFEFRIGDLSWRLDIIRRDNSFGCWGSFRDDIIAGDTSGNTKKFDHVVELTVEISANSDRSRYGLNIGLYRLTLISSYSILVDARL